MSDGILTRDPHPKTPGKSEDFYNSGAESGAPGTREGANRCDDDTVNSSELQAIIDALAAIPEADRPGIVEHLTALAGMSPERLAALLTLTRTDSNRG